MAGNRKLNRPTDQRVAVMRGLTTDLLWYGRIETTEARAKEVRKQAEKIITMGIKTYEDVITVTKSKIKIKNNNSFLGNIILTISFLEVFRFLFHLK